MATFMDMFNQAGQGLSGAFQNPWTQLGMQMLGQGGWQAGNPGFGQRFAAAGQGFMQQQAQAQAAQRAQVTQQLEMAKAKAEYEKTQREQQTRQTIMERVRNDPTFMSDSPMARSILEITGDPSQLKDLGSLQPKGPGAPKMPYHYAVKNPDGTETQMVYDQSAPGGYRAGATYRPTSQQNVDLRGQTLEQTGAQRETALSQAQQRIDAAEANAQRMAEQRDRQLAQGDQRIAAEAARAEAARIAAETKAEANRVKATVKREDLTRGYNGAVRQIDTTLKLIKELEDSKGLNNLFGVRGQIPFTVPSSDTAFAQTRMERLKGGLGLGELIRLEQNGVKLTPVSNTDLQKVEQSAAALGSLQSAEDARAELGRIRETLENAKKEAEGNYKAFSSAYDTPSESSGYEADAAEAAALIQQRPDLADEVNRRLQQKYGKGL